MVQQSPFTGISLKAELIKFAENMNRRNQDSKAASTTRGTGVDTRYTWSTLYRVGASTSLKPPQCPFVEGPDQPHLMPGQPLQDENLYWQQHPEIAFVYYNHYQSASQVETAQTRSKDGVSQVPKPHLRSLSFKAHDMISALTELKSMLSQDSPSFSTLLDNFDLHVEMQEPFVIMYHILPHIKAVNPRLSETQRYLLNLLHKSISANHGEEYEYARHCAAEGKVTQKLMQYFIRPGDVLVHSHESCSAVWLVTGWPKEVSALPEDSEHKMRRGPKKAVVSDRITDPGADEFATTREQDFDSQRSNVKKYSWKVSAWTLVFNGEFYKNSREVTVDLKAAHEDEEVALDSLSMYPLHFAKPELRTRLEKRGNTFWKCRDKRLVSYEDDSHGDLGSVRYCSQMTLGRYCVVLLKSATRLVRDI